MSCNLFAMPWIKSCLCHQEKKKAPSISPPIHLLLKADGSNSHGSNHAFRCKVFKKPRPCHLCHQPILHQGSCCRVCKYVCHSVCESKEAAERFSDTSWQIHHQWRENRPIDTQNQQNAPTKPKTYKERNEDANNTKKKQTHSHDELERNGSRLTNMNINKMACTTSQPTRSYFQSNSRYGVVDTTMDLNYVTERIIALWFPASMSGASYRRGQRQAAHMLRGKHGDNYMVFNLSEPRRAIHAEHSHVKEVGWPPRLAPPLERLCSVCKDIDSWLSQDKHRIAVLHARGTKDRLGVVVAAYMHYSSICGTAEQALDRFSMRRFLDEGVGAMELPSSRRYVDYFAGLLSGGIRINAAPLYLTHVTVLGAPAFEAHGGCKAFLKVYEGLTPVYTSGVYSVGSGARQFTVTVSGGGGAGLRLRGDILVKCYHRHVNGRDHVFSCQFHTCAVTDYTLSFTRPELDMACNDPRFPTDGAVELHFSATPETRQPTPAPTPAVPVVLTDDPITRYNSYENIRINDEEEDDDEDDEEEEDVNNHTFGPLDGSIYATIAKKQELSPGAVSSPLTVSMDSGISSAGHQQIIHTITSSVSPPLTLTAQPSPFTPEDQHRELDDLLTDMLSTVENIPDVTPKYRRSYKSGTGNGNGNRLDSSDTDSRVRHISQTVNVHRDTCLPQLQSQQDVLSSVVHTLDNVSFIDDDDDDDNNDDNPEIPYHARQHSRPFTYGSVKENTGNMIGEGKGLASPSLVRKASFNKSSGDTLKKVQTQVYNPRETDDDDGDDDDIIARVFTAAPASVPVPVHATPYSDSDSLSPPSGYRNSPRSPEFHENYAAIGGNLTWLQRQQQKLKERRDVQRRDERQTHETQLISELRSMQSRSRHMRPTASHRLDGYTSDTTAFADDDDDFAIPLHINTTTTTTNKIVSPTLPNRTSSMKRYTTTTNSGHMTTQSLRRQGERERPFMAVKRAHEQNRKYHESQSPPQSPASVLAANPLGHAIRSPTSRGDGDNTGLLSMVEQQQQQQQQQQHGKYGGSNTMYREEFSWRTTSDTDGASPPRSVSPRPQTPAFPVLPRTPYGNSTPTVQFADSPTERLPPKSPTTQRRVSYPTTTATSTATSTSTSTITYGLHNNRDIVGGRWSNSQDASKDLYYSNGNTNSNNNNIMEVIQTTTNQRNYNDTYQQSPKNASPTVYYGNSRRSSVHSNSEPPQEVSPVHVKFVRDTSKYWYKPTISREEAIALLRAQPPGTFVVRDSNSFPGAFGMALKVATPPPPPPTGGGRTSTSGSADELVRHFLIEPTSRGVRLKGCANEPVFSSLSALVYQHSITQMALPCKLLLPEVDVGARSAEGALATSQLLLSQGAACNVLYLTTVEMESLTGPQAVRKAVLQLFRQAPLPAAAVVHFKVAGQGVTLTDNKRQLFFRKHYPIAAISHCGLDPDDHRWTISNDHNGIPITSNHIFGFVARKPTSNTDNQCHIFAELEPDQPATAIVNFVNKIINSTSINKSNIL